MGYKISERLKQLRLEKGWSQAEAARRCGLKRKTNVSAIERNFTNFGVDKLAGICRGFGVSADYIIGRTDKRA